MIVKKIMLYVFLVVSTGFAMFAMFFGSGNLVFPIMLGEMVAEHYTFAAVGLVISAIIVPFLGVIVIFLFEGDYEKFFRRLGKHADFWLPLLILALIGPFGVIPRCITVAHGSLLLLFPNIPFIIFALIMTGALFVLVLDPHKIVPLIGMFLTPILLLSLGMIIVYGIVGSELPHAAESATGALTSFYTGITQGYYTLDLMGAFFFSVVVIKYVQFTLLKYHIVAHRQHQFMWGAVLCGMTMLAIVYIAFVYLGMVYSDVLDVAYPERAITLIADHALGRLGSPVVAIAVILTTLTTAAALTTVSAGFLRQRLLFGRVNLPVASGIILILSFLFSNLKFTGITAFLGPVLQVLYPGLIVLTVLNIAHRLWGIRIVKTPVYGVFVITLLGQLLI